MKKILTLIMVLCMIAGMAACASTAPAEDSASNEAAGAEETNTYKIAVLIKSTENPFWAMVSAGVSMRTEEIASEIGEENIDVDIIAMDSQTSFEQQVGQIEDAGIAGYNIIVICPSDGETVVPAVEESVKGGIPVVAIQDPISTDMVAAYVAGNNTISCEQTAEYLATQIDGSGAIGVIRGQQGSTIETVRYEGFANYMAENYPEIEIVSEAFADWTAEKASAAMEDFLNAHPEIEGVFTECDAMGGAAVQICIANNRTDVKVVSHDGNLEQLHQVKEGTLYSTVSLDPQNIGYLGIDTAYRILCGEEVEAQVDVPTIFCTQDENTDVEIAKWEAQGF